MTDWRWNPRFDSDLYQRCLTIIVMASLAKITLCHFCPFLLIQEWIVFGADMAALLLLVAAFAKSSLQLNPEGKSVLITGRPPKV